jgi:hypothetical protein
VPCGNAWLGSPTGIDTHAIASVGGGALRANVALRRILASVCRRLYMPVCRSERIGDGMAGGTDLLSVVASLTGRSRSFAEIQLLCTRLENQNSAPAWLSREAR